MTAPTTEIDRAIDRSGLRPVGRPTEVVVARDIAEVQETVRRAASRSSAKAG